MTTSRQRKWIKYLIRQLFRENEDAKNHIYEAPRNVYGFDDHKNDLIEQVSLDVMLMREVLIVDFLLMRCKSPYNVIL